MVDCDWPSEFWRAISLFTGRCVWVRFIATISTQSNWDRKSVNYANLFRSSYLLVWWMEWDTLEELRMVWTWIKQNHLKLSDHLPICSFPVNSEFKAKTLQPMQYGRYNYASAVVGDKIYVAGGKNGRGSYMSSVECYDPVNNTWTEVSSMNRPRAKFALAESNGRLYAMGHVDVIERYDPAQDVWTVVWTQQISSECGIQNLVTWFSFFQIGFFDDSETIKQGVTLRSEIYVLTSNTFGKFKPERGCSLLSLRCVPNTNAIEHTLFVN